MRAILKRRRAKLGRQSGVTMIELMMAGMVMVVGFLGLMILITTAIATNNRNKLDTNSTLVAQMVMEEVKSNYMTGNSPAVTDCAGQNWNVAWAAGGSTVSGGNIDFTVAPVANYYMYYTVCTADGTQATYEVRWAVQALTSGTAIVTVGARSKGASSNLKYFALPVTLRGYAGV